MKCVHYELCFSIKFSDFLQNKNELFFQLILFILKRLRVGKKTKVSLTPSKTSASFKVLPLNLLAERLFF